MPYGLHYVKALIITVTLMNHSQFIFICTQTQQLIAFEQDRFYKSWLISTAKKGVGELLGSECTPRGWHQVHAKIGMDTKLNSVFVARKWTGEVYTAALAAQYPVRDWILTRIIQLEGLENGRNKGGNVDTLQRYIYIHGTPDTTDIKKPGSHGCIRMRNADMIELANWVSIDTRVCIE